MRWLLNMGSDYYIEHFIGTIFRRCLLKRKQYLLSMDKTCFYLLQYMLKISLFILYVCIFIVYKNIESIQIARNTYKILLKWDYSHKYWFPRYIWLLIYTRPFLKTSAVNDLGVSTFYAWPHFKFVSQGVHLCTNFNCFEVFVRLSRILSFPDVVHVYMFFCTHFVYKEAWEWYLLY